MASRSEECDVWDAMLGDRATAEANLRHALELHERFGAVYWTARTQLDLADVIDAPELVKPRGPRSTDTASRACDLALTNPPHPYAA